MTKKPTQAIIFRVQGITWVADLYHRDGFLAELARLSSPWCILYILWTIRTLVIIMIMVVLIDMIILFMIVTLVNKTFYDHDIGWSHGIWYIISLYMMISPYLIWQRSTIDKDTSQLIHLTISVHVRLWWKSEWGSIFFNRGFGWTSNTLNTILKKL